MDLKIELNICLLPDAELSANLVAASRHYETATPYPCIVTLQGTNILENSDNNENKENTLKCGPRPRLLLAPHLTLYQVSLPIAALAPACEKLHTLSSTLSMVDAHATEVVLNAGEGSLEQRYGVTDALRAAQGRVVEALNPLRGSLLLERDPAGAPRILISTHPMDNHTLVCHTMHLLLHQVEASSFTYESMTVSTKIPAANLTLHTSFPHSSHPSSPLPTHPRPSGNVPDPDHPHIASCGFPEVGADFRPHATLNWYRMDARPLGRTEVGGTEVSGTEMSGSEVGGTEVGGTEVGENGSARPDPDPVLAPPMACLSGRYDTLAVCVLGPQGTCPQTLATFALRGYVDWSH